MRCIAFSGRDAILRQLLVRPDGTVPTEIADAPALLTRIADSIATGGKEVLVHEIGSQMAFRPGGDSAVATAFAADAAEALADSGLANYVLNPDGDGGAPSLSWADRMAAARRPFASRLLPRLPERRADALDARGGGVSGRGRCGGGRGRTPAASAEDAAAGRGGGGATTGRNRRCSRRTLAASAASAASADAGRARNALCARSSRAPPRPSKSSSGHRGRQRAAEEARRRMRRRRRRRAGGSSANHPMRPRRPRSVVSPHS